MGQDVGSSRGMPALPAIGFLLSMMSVACALAEYGDVDRIDMKTGVRRRRGSDRDANIACTANVATAFAMHCKHCISGIVCTQPRLGVCAASTRHGGMQRMAFGPRQ